MTDSNTQNSTTIVSPNPFFLGIVPPEQFLGRKYEITTILDQIANRSHIAICGSSGISKSSLLKYLTSDKAWNEWGLSNEFSQAIVVYYTCCFPFNPNQFWREILQELVAIVRNDPEMSDLPQVIDEIVKKSEIERSDLRQVLTKIGKKGKFLVLLLDDYDIALSSHENYTEIEMLTFLGQFRNLVQAEEGKYLATVVASSRPLNQLGPRIPPLGSPWYNYYFFLPLKPYNDDEVSELLSRIPPECTLSDEQKEELKKLTDGHPKLIQTALYFLYQNYQQGRKYIDQNFERNFISATQQILQHTWESSTLEEQLLLIIIALESLQGRLPGNAQFSLSGIDNILSQKERSLNELEDQGIIEKRKVVVEKSTELRGLIQEERTVYKFSSALMEWWVIQEVLNQGEETEIHKRRITALGLSRAQVTQINNAIRWLSENKDLALSIIDWFSRLLPAFVTTC